MSSPLAPKEKTRPELREELSYLRKQVNEARLERAVALGQLAELREDVEQLRVQLSGCSVAALGYASDDVDSETWGWSQSFEDVRRLYREKEALRRRVARLEAGVNPDIMKFRLCWQIDGKTMALEFLSLSEAETHQQDIEGWLPGRTRIETIASPDPPREGPFEVLPVPTVHERLLQEDA